MKFFSLSLLLIYGFFTLQANAQSIYDMLNSGERKEAIKILRYLSDIENNIDAKYILGILYNDASSINLCHIDDFCITKSLSNYQKAKEIFLKLYKEHNDPRAAYALGEFYDDHWFFSKDYKSAYNYYLFSAKLGIPEAQYNVANMYELGDGVKKDLVQSVRWYLQCNVSSLCGAGKEGIDDLIAQISEEDLKYAESLVDFNLNEVDIRITVARQIVAN